MTFPYRKKKIFIEEYVLPQLFTTLLIENGYKGIVYPSTKDFSDISNYHRFSKYNNNIALFVEYNKNDDYDFDLLDTFHTFVLDGTEKLNFEPNDIK